jgi:probable HAF family extracellular repeat protein
MRLALGRYASGKSRPRTFAIRLKNGDIDMASTESTAWTIVTTLSMILTIPLTPWAQQQTTPLASPGNHHHYKLIDVGTFGGPNAYLSVSFAGEGETALNRRGMAVGAADTPNRDPYYPNCFVDCYLLHAFQWQDGVLTDLGGLPGNNSSFAFSSNNRGQIVGISQTGPINPVLGSPDVHGVLWTDGAIIDLGTLGGIGSITGAVNDQGQVVGAALNNIPGSFGGSLAIQLPFPTATQLHAFLWENGVMQDLGTLGGPDSEAQYLNERGQVAGQSYTDATPNPPVTAHACQTSGIPTEHPFLWQEGSLIDLGSLGGSCGYANWLTNRGEVVGTMTLRGDTMNHGFLWERGSLIDLGALGGHNSEAWFANDAGEVVGRADFSPTSTNHHAFLWSHGVMKDLGTPNDFVCSTAYGINARHQVVGDSGVCNVGGNGWLWEHGSIVDLNTLVPPDTKEHVLGAEQINDRGEILAGGLLPDGSTRVVVLIPCDEDHPGVERCDYSPADTTLGAEARPADRPQIPSSIANDNHSPARFRNRSHELQQ